MMIAELELVVELLGQALGVDDLVVRADDRVDVLEEHDALVHRVRPVDGGELLVVIGEVAGRVEELLRPDRRLELHVGVREALAGLGDVAAALEVLAGRGHVEFDDGALFELETADAAAVEGDELHGSVSVQCVSSVAAREVRAAAQAPTMLKPPSASM